MEKVAKVPCIPPKALEATRKKITPRIFCNFKGSLTKSIGPISPKTSSTINAVKIAWISLKKTSIGFLSWQRRAL